MESEEITDEDLQARVNARMRESVRACASEADRQMPRSFPVLTEHRDRDLVSYVRSVMSKACGESDARERTFWDDLHARYGGKPFAWKSLQA